MKKQILKALTTASLILLCTWSAATNASAQTQQRSRYTASIPFAFQMGERTLPAGDYIIEYSRMSDDQVILRLTSEGTESATRFTHSVQTRSPRARTVLVFNRYGEQSFLAQMWKAGEVRGRQVQKSAQELAIERELAQQRRPNELAKREAPMTIELAVLAK
jgi:hypothetical protein